MNINKEILTIQEDDILVLTLGRNGYGFERITARVVEFDFEEGHDKAVCLRVITGGDHRDYTLWIYEVRGRWIHGFNEEPVKLIAHN